MIGCAKGEAGAAKSRVASAPNEPDIRPCRITHHVTTHKHPHTPPPLSTHARTHACTHARERAHTPTCMHACMHAREGARETTQARARETYVTLSYYGNPYCAD